MVAKNGEDVPTGPPSPAALPVVPASRGCRVTPHTPPQRGSTRLTEPRVGGIADMGSVKSGTRHVGEARSGSRVLPGRLRSAPHDSPFTGGPDGTTPTDMLKGPARRNDGEFLDFGGTGTTGPADTPTLETIEGASSMAQRTRTPGQPDNGTQQPAVNTTPAMHSEPVTTIHGTR